MEANRNNIGMGTGGTGYNPGRQDDMQPCSTGAGSTGAGSEFSPGRGAEGRMTKEPAQAAKDMLRDGKQAARQVVQEGKQAAKEIGQEVKSQAQEVVQDLKGSADQYLTQGREVIGDQIGCISKALHGAADEMGGNPQGQRIAGLTHSLAGKLDEAVDFIQYKEPREIIRGVENFARREPVLFLSGCLLAGVLAARFLKASTPTGGGGVGGWSGNGRGPDRWDRDSDSQGNFGSSSPMDTDAPRGPLDNIGIGFRATPIDVTPRSPEAPPELKGGL